MFGIAAEEAQAWVGDDVNAEFEVWPENWLTVQMFLLLQTQWRIAAGMTAQWIGLDYTATEAAMRMLGIARSERQEIFTGLCAMERAALPLLNRKRE